MYKKVVLALSGGMDSTTLLGYYLENMYTVYPVTFLYGSKHNEYEKQAVRDIIDYYNQKLFACNLPAMDHHFITLDFNLFESNLLKSGGDIPEGHYEDTSMKKTVVPGRNMIFASILAGYAESIKANLVGLGVHNGDHAIYPDCRKEFIMAMNTAVYLSSDGIIEIDSPFIKMDKYNILKLGYLNPTATPYHLTRTCYKDQTNSCGKCGSCTERLEAFSKLNLVDPIHYD